MAGRHVGYGIGDGEPLLRNEERGPDDVATAGRQVRDQGVEAGVLDLELEAESLGHGTRAFDVETYRLVGVGHARRGEELHGRVLDVDAVCERAGLD